ncbi:hypothetical protein ABN034_33780 [Actinopolymorpha sp. B11F2]|uniref:hypothetical protein n=1 Tax=Actinopolymorpha sp. B11F2 TaxID=3160862 RepID=UPI0032E3ADDE
MQSTRVVEGCGRHSEVPDAYLLVLALRNVRRAADMALRHLVTAKARDQLRAALDEFETRLPGAKEARDVIEHFDDYSGGVGDQQQPAIRQRDSRVPDEQLAQQYRIDFEHVVNDPARSLLHVGPHIVDLTAAGRAASQLVHEMWLAAKTEDG